MWNHILCQGSKLHDDHFRVKVISRLNMLIYKEPEKTLIKPHKRSDKD